MAKQVITTLIDDLDPEQAADETVTFALDGVSYEIDLSADHSGQLRAALRPFLDAARRVTSGRTVHSVNVRSRRASGTSRKERAAIRAWAAGQRIELNGRGRIPGNVVAQYRAAMSGKPVSPAAPAPAPEAKAAIGPPADLGSRKLGELRQMVADRGGSSMTRASRAGCIKWLLENWHGTPAALATAEAGRAMAAGKATAPDLSGYTPAQRREYLEQVRAWSRHHGYELSGKGRIPATVHVAYEAQNPSMLPSRG